MHDYLTQVCTLAAPPLRVLSAARSSGTTSLDRFKALLEAAAPERFEVFATNQATAELYLSACALPGGLWVLAPTSGFGAACGRGHDTTRPTTSITTTTAAAAAAAATNLGLGFPTQWTGSV